MICKKASLHLLLAWELAGLHPGGACAFLHGSYPLCTNMGLGEGSGPREHQGPPSASLGPSGWWVRLSLGCSWEINHGKSQASRGDVFLIYKKCFWYAKEWFISKGSVTKEIFVPLVTAKDNLSWRGLVIEQTLLLDAARPRWHPERGDLWPPIPSGDNYTQ